MKKLCIFDLDGTLASTLESMAVAANRVLREMNLPEQPTESFKYFAGDGAKELCRRCLRAAGDAECSSMRRCTGNTGNISARPVCTKSFPTRGFRSFWKSSKQQALKFPSFPTSPMPRRWTWWRPCLEKAILTRSRGRPTAFRESRPPSGPTVSRSISGGEKGLPLHRRYCHRYGNWKSSGNGNRGRSLGLP